MDIDENTPRKRDAIAVTAFAGNIWGVGEIVVVFAKKQGRKMVKLHSVVFEADGKYTDLPLNPANYGPARVVKGHGGKPDTVKAVGSSFVRRQHSRKRWQVTAGMAALQTKGRPQPPSPT
jgi:hypothetical protein